MDDRVHLCKFGGGGQNLLAVPLGFRSQKLNQHPLQYLLVPGVPLTPGPSPGMVLGHLNTCCFRAQ